MCSSICFIDSNADSADCQRRSPFIRAQRAACLTACVMAGSGGPPWPGRCPTGCGPV